MKIISSQHFLNWGTVERKMNEIAGMESVEIPCCEIGEIDGVEYAVQIDGHHTLAAARELGGDDLLRPGQREALALQRGYARHVRGCGVTYRRHRQCLPSAHP